MAYSITITDYYIQTARKKMHSALRFPPPAAAMNSELSHLSTVYLYRDGSNS